MTQEQEIEDELFNLMQHVQAASDYYRDGDAVSAGVLIQKAAKQFPRVKLKLEFFNKGVKWEEKVNK